MTSGDIQLRRHVQDELEWEPSVDPAQIGVSVRDAIVTLSGSVESFAQKHTAGEVVAAIRGVRAVANELEVKLSIDAERADGEIAHTIASIFTWDSRIPKDRLKVLVANGWVTLEGTVDWHFQRTTAERVVRGLMGVKGITNSIAIKPVVSPGDAKSKLEAALIRKTRNSATNFCIAVDENTVILSGPVLSPTVRDAIEAIAWKTPGIARVQNDLHVEPLEVLELAELT